MEFVQLRQADGIATVTLSRGKVNALNEPLLAELAQVFRGLAADADVRAVILTGSGKFFSFGFDIPEFFGYPPEAFRGVLENFSRLCQEMFLFPKPLIAALNGHTVAGGCVLALPCDYRLMVTGKAKISLNEITFGSTVFGGIGEMLAYVVGHRHAELILLRGALHTAEEARTLGLVDQLATEETLAADARAVAAEYAGREAAAFASLKTMLRQPTAAVIAARQADSLREFLHIWYSENTRKKLQEIKIHG